MATHSLLHRLSLREGADKRKVVGAWWPRSRQLGEALPELFALWPREAGRISRVLYSPPDWDDHPRMVAIPGRRVKTGAFPRDDTHELVLSMADRTRRRISVIPADTSAREAHQILDGFDAVDRGAAHPVWDNEGGSF